LLQFLNFLTFVLEIPDVTTKILQTLSGQNCSVMPWVMLKCLKKTFFSVREQTFSTRTLLKTKLQACPDAEVIKRGEMIVSHHNQRQIFTFRYILFIFCADATQYFLFCDAVNRFSALLRLHNVISLEKTGK